MKKRSGSQTYWVGIDWGKEQHAVSIVDGQRRLVTQFMVQATLRGMERLGDTLAALDSVEGIAIETCRAQIFYYLLSKRYRLYPINPKLSKQWRDGTSVAGIKTDARDGRVLAMELARRHEELRAYSQTDPVTAELLGLCNKQRSLIDQRTALVHQLREALNAFYPAALDFFDDLTSPTAWAFFKRFPNPQTLAKSRKQTLLSFLRAHRIGLKPLWLERVENRAAALDWPKVPGALAEEEMMLACVAQLIALQARLNHLEKLIEQYAAPLPETKILRTLPGAGPCLGPALCAMVRSVDVQAEGGEALRCLSGIAPVDESSGKRRRVRIRRRCNKKWRTTLHLFAWSSATYCRWAKAFYDLCKERGDNHATALRKLADKWLRIIKRMIETGESYDDERYVQALRATHSPVYDRLCAKLGG